MNRIYGRLMRIGVLGLDFRIGGVGILEGMVRVLVGLGTLLRGRRDGGGIGGQELLDLGTGI